MPFVAFVNAASRLSNTEADIIVEALRMQARDDFQDLWPGIQIFPPIFVASEKNLPQDAYPIVFVDNPDVANADAYHSVDRGGKYFGHVFVNTLLAEGKVFETVSKGASHEYFELLGNPTCCRFVNGPRIAEGNRYCFELCDPVQMGSYSKTVERAGRTYQVQVSDIVGPGYFNMPGPLSILNAPKGPFLMADGGYQIVENEHGNDSNVWALGSAKHPPTSVMLRNGLHSRGARRLRKETEIADVAALAFGRW